MIKKNKFCFFAFVINCFIIIAINSCKKEDKTPILTTNEPKSITSITAISGGKITDDGDEVITDRGVCWSTIANPTIDLSTKTNDGKGLGLFTSSISDLSAATKYYVRAYATNKYGTSYGDEKSFVTNGIVVDIEGNVYNTIIIGTQTWMKENLKVTKYQNNEPIPNMADDNDWTSQTTGAYCWYNNDLNNNETYGALYNWYAVVDSRNLCPTGWHIPTDAEWTTLVNFLGGSDVAGVKMKATSMWSTANVGATNISGFTAYPGGNRFMYLYAEIGASGSWWSSTEDNSSNALFRSLYFDSPKIFSVSHYKICGHSVRCLKD